eukprot:SAG11_NODE_4670_length_1813_cov_1.348308_3_plen_86_part_00
MPGKACDEIPDQYYVQNHKCEDSKQTLNCVLPTGGYDRWFFFCLIVISEYTCYGVLSHSATPLLITSWHIDGLSSTKSTGVRPLS